MDVELLKAHFGRVLENGISEGAVLSGLPDSFVLDDGNTIDHIDIVVTWQNLKAEEVRGLYGFSAPYAGSVIASDIPGLRFLSSQEISKLYLEIGGEQFDILSITPYNRVAVRLDLGKKVKR